jgi:hypothetical protein
MGRTVRISVYATTKATPTIVPPDPSTRSGAARMHPTAVVPHRMMRMGCRNWSALAAGAPLRSRIS